MCISRFSYVIKYILKNIVLMIIQKLQVAKTPFCLENSRLKLRMKWEWKQIVAHVPNQTQEICIVYLKGDIVRELISH